MRLKKSWSLAARLRGGFAIVLALMVLVAGLGVWRLASIHASLDHVLTVTNAQYQEAMRMRIASNQGARAVRDAILTSEAAELANVQTLVRNSRSDYDAAEERLAKLLAQASDTSSAQRTAFDETRERKTEARVGEDEILKLADQGKSYQATSVLEKKSKPAHLKWSSSLGALADLEQSLATAAGEMAGNTYRTGRLQLIGLSVLALLIGGFVAERLVRKVRSQLGGDPRYAADVVERIASGDLATPIALGKKDAGSLLASMQRMQQNLARVVGEIRAGSESIATGSGQIAAGATDLSQRTEQQASNLQETAASMEQLNSAVRNNADTARQASALASSASTVAIKGGEVVGRVVGTMQQISASSKKIADIIGVIDGIAFQTNILALNAAVEAARAGEQGRGFAVVASEVRSLAQRSAAAAKEIKELIGDSVAKVGNGTALVDEAGRTMHDVVSQVQRVSDLIGEISAASLEQTSGIEQVNHAVVQLDQVTQQNAALVEESAAAAASLTQQASRLAQAVAVFRLDATTPAEAASAGPANLLAGAAVSNPRASLAPAARERHQASGTARLDHHRAGDQAPVVLSSAAGSSRLAGARATTAAFANEPLPASGRANTTPQNGGAKTSTANAAESDWESF